MITKFLLFACIIFLSLHSFAQNGDTILLNKTYKVKVTEDPNTPQSNVWTDKIIFKNNKLYFKVFSKNWGFPYAPCTISIDSSTNSIHFETGFLGNAEGDSRFLSGTITRDSIKGTVEIIRWDNVKRPYSFSGGIK